MQEMKVILSHSQSFSLFLKAYCKIKTENSRYFSLRQLSQKMGYKTPSLLSDILNQKRSPSLDILQRFSDVQSLEALEMQFLKNLMIIETSSLSEAKARAQKENDLICQLWQDSSFKSPESHQFSSLDVIIMGKIDDNQGITIEELVENYSELIPYSTLVERLELMLKRGDIVEDENRKLLRGNKINFSLAGSQSFPELRDLIERAADQKESTRQQDILTLNLSQKKFMQAKEILRHACQNIYMLALEEHENPNSEPSEIYTLYSIFFQVTNTDKNTT